MEALSETLRRRAPAGSADVVRSDRISQSPASPSSPGTNGGGLACESIPYPTELVALEKRDALPPNLLQLLTLRRFADPRTGVWETTTADVAKLLVCGRSTAQKTLRAAERHGYIHVRHKRTRTVRLIAHFGGFPFPEHIQLGLPPLRWDPGFTEPSTEREQNSELSTPGENSAGGGKPSLDKPKGPPADAAPGTVRLTNNERTNNERNERVRVLNNEQNERNERFVPTGVETSEHRSYTLVPDFHPRNSEESVVKDLALGLGERYINSFLDLYRRHGLRPLQQACGVAHGKLRDRNHPLRGRPGAFVRWQLKNGHFSAPDQP